MELVRENIVLNKHVGRERSQMLLEGDIIVPDVKPDIASVLRVSPRIFMSRMVASVNRVSFSGKMSLDVLYLAKTGEVSVHSIFTNTGIDDFLNMEGVAPHMQINLSASLANIEYRIVNDRKINYRAVVDISASAWENKAYSAVSHISGLPAAQQKSLNFTMNNMVAFETDQFTIRDEIVLPPGRPAIGELLQVSLNIANKEVSAAQGRVDISGSLLVSPLYKGIDESSVIEFEEFELPFSGSLDVNTACDDSFVDVGLSLADFIVDVGPDEEVQDRIISLEAIISADIRLTENQNMEILQDAYCIGQNLTLKTEGTEYLSLICRNKNQFSVKEVVVLEGAPEALQILNISCIAGLEEQKVVDDKIVVEGIVEAGILYVANCDIDPLFNYTAHIPIRQVIEAKGARMGMEAGVAHWVDNISFNMLSPTEVELRLTLSFDALLQQSVPVDFIQDIEFTPLNKEALDNLPSMTILVTEKNDSLWAIAKKYNADLEELAAINTLTPEASLTPGQKLLVVKKVTDE